MKKEQIVDYYDTCESDYKLFWDLNHSHAMHAGYWDHQTRTLRQALKRENEILAELAHVKKSDKILDAGCGVGGSAIFLAETFGCHVTGITLSQKQVETAKQKAAAVGVTELTFFDVMDYTKTKFQNHTFDLIWGIESICHAPHKSLFVKEAARLLKPDGRIIIADGFANPNSSKNQDKMQRWLKGWGVSALEEKSAFESYLKQYGFTDIQFHDITKNVIPSSRRLYWLSWPAIPLSKIGEWIGLRSPVQTANLFSARCQYQTLKHRLWQYGIFIARKG